jgi:hypothetical protein
LDCRYDRSLFIGVLGYGVAKWIVFVILVVNHGAIVMSDVGIEKVVVELNSFRQRTAMIKEEIAKVSRALNERAQQLNDIVGKSLSNLREQLGGTTLTGYLALQGKYNSGEITESDYASQKDYYKNEMQGMLRRLDETRKLMMLMAQLDSRQPGATPGPPRPPAPTS